MFRSLPLAAVFLGTVLPAVPGARADGEGQPAASAVPVPVPAAGELPRPTAVESSTGDHPAEAAAAPAVVPAEVAESLAKANAEAARLREENARLRLQAETLGLAGLKPELRPLQERLIAAVSDYRLAERRSQELSDRVVSLSEAALALLSDSSSPAARERVQKELAAANQTLASARAQAAVAPVPPEGAKVISLKDELGLAVINAGLEGGLRLGTPMRIVRADETVATGLVVDVRGRVAGVLLTSAPPPGTLRIGDLAKPETISTLK